MKPFVIGICGGSGSGKTTLLKRLSSHFGNTEVAVFTMDNYYFPIEQQEKDTKMEYEKGWCDIVTRRWRWWWFWWCRWRWRWRWRCRRCHTFDCHTARRCGGAVRPVYLSLAGLARLPFETSLSLPWLRAAHLVCVSVAASGCGVSPAGLHASMLTICVLLKE